MGLFIFSAVMLVASVAVFGYAVSVVSFVGIVFSVITVCLAAFSLSVGYHTMKDNNLPEPER